MPRLIKPDRLLRLPVRPGSMLSDVSKNDLGETRHELVQNLKQIRKNEWGNVRPYINSYSAFTNLLAGIEVTSDAKGTPERFILAQDGTHLYRIDYDAVSSPVTGYENETPAEITLPSGVSILSTQKLRFFVFRGIVRITGAVLTSDTTTQVPLWYGYIFRTIFPWAHKRIDLDWFLSDTESWAGTSATCTRYDCDIDTDSAGMGYAPKHHYALKIDTVSLAGYASKSFTVDVGQAVYVYMKIYRASGGTGNIKVTFGTTLGGAQYSSNTQTSTTEDEWVTISTHFLATSSTLYVNIYPDDGAAGVCYANFILVYELLSPMPISGWYLEKAEVENITNGIVEIISYQQSAEPVVTADFIATGKVFAEYDFGQYSKINDITNEAPWYASNRISDKDNELYYIYRQGGYLQVFLRFDGSSLSALANIPRKRLTGIGFCSSFIAPASRSFKESDVTYYVREILDITTDLPTEFFTNKFFYDATYKNRLYLQAQSPEEMAAMECLYFEEGQEVILRLDDDHFLVTMITDVTIDVLGSVSSITIADPVYPELKSLDTDGNVSLGVTLTRRWNYSAADGYTTIIAFEASDTSYSFQDYSDFPSTENDIAPEYSHHIVVNERAMCLSLESDESDIIRFSPISQFDVFPSGNIIQSPVGDRDSNLALTELDQRFIILKQTSGSQGQFVGDSHYHDKSIIDHGLYATYGFIIINNLLYLMGKEDIFVFNGAATMGWLENALIQQLYMQYVDTNSFMAHNPLDHEIWIFLNGYILVYHYAEKEFYYRKTDITPRFAFRDIDRRLFIATQTKLVLVNHEESEADESIICKFTTGIKDLSAPEYRKKLVMIMSRIKSNAALTMQVTDPNETRVFSETKTPEDGQIDLLRFQPNYFFREAQITGTFATTDEPDILIKSADLQVRRWR